MDLYKKVKKHTIILSIIECRQKSDHILNLTSSGPTKSETEINHIGWSEHKYF